MHRSMCNLKIVNNPLRYSPVLRKQEEKSKLPTSVILATFATGICFCSTSAISAIHRDDIHAIAGSLFGEKNVKKGKIAWWGQYGYGKYKDGKNKHVWIDKQDNAKNASGLPQTTPGIALRNAATLGHWWKVELKGKIYEVQQTELGPAKHTGRLFDVSASLADKVGWTPDSFPTDTEARIQYIGPYRPIPIIDPPIDPKVAALKQKKRKRMTAILTWSGMTWPIEAEFPLAHNLPPQPLVRLASLTTNIPPPPEKPKSFADLKPQVVGKEPHGLHPVIKHSMLEATKLLPAGWRIRFDNAARDHSSVGSSSYHIKSERYQGKRYALAADIEIIDDRGRKIPNIASPRNFAIYRDFMHWTKKFQYELYPEYRGTGRWGGYFVSGVSQDLMHYDLGSESGTMAGNWEGGLKRAYRHFGKPEDVGKGMGKISTFVLPPVPGPLPLVPIIERVAELPGNTARMALGLGRHSHRFRR